MSRTTDRCVCIHGHFYQPPRENPWLDHVEAEPSAAPFHDWNDRINAECYAANAVARLQTPEGRLTDIVRNYDRISFNFGPTLLSWMQTADRRTYDEIVDADRASVLRQDGHGNAMAQGYNHLILPLASDRDRRTQIRWGRADFRARFGRDPEGMWLPETAVDSPTLDDLAAEGMRFAVLSPRQAEAVAPADRDDWRPVHEGILDTTTAYRCDLPSGRSIALFFYDGSVAQGIAFGGLLNDGAGFAARLASSFAARPADGPRLVHVATDGESYGHHHRFGEMALAFALRQLIERHDVTLVNYGRFLDLRPPRDRVRIRERSSWSCAHGVERWRSDCSCRIGGEHGWNQAWRAPLRTALDSLKTGLDAAFERFGGAWLADPWAARDEYVAVVLDRSADAVDRFLARHGKREWTAPGRLDALRALEMQRCGMLMFTSCGWFFDDVSGIETAQILKYACRAARLAAELGAEDLEVPLVRALEAARSNVPAEADGASVYRRRVAPLAVDLDRVAAHHAIWSIVEPHQVTGDHAVYAYRVRRLDWDTAEYSGSRLAVGRARVVGAFTGEAADVIVGAVHFGGHDFRCSVRRDSGPEDFRAIRDDLFAKYDRQSLADVVTAMNRHFGETGGFTLRDTFAEERRRILDRVVARTLDELETGYLDFYRSHGRLLGYLAESDYPLPEALRVTVEFALVREVEALIGAVAVSDGAGEGLEGLLAETHRLAARVGAWRVSLRRDRVRRLLTDALLHHLERFGERPAADAVRALHALLDVAADLGLEADRWRVQNAAFRVLTDPAWPTLVAEPDPAARARLMDEVIRLADRLEFSLARVSRL
jgi:alpha-amylase/alpha-mannosidase (GH57 family)